MHKHQKRKCSRMLSLPSVYAPRDLDRVDTERTSIEATSLPFDCRDPGNVARSKRSPINSGA